MERVTTVEKLDVDKVKLVLPVSNSEQRRHKCYSPEYTIDNVAKEVSVKVYARDYPDAKSSFMTSEKEEKHQENIMITTGKRQEKASYYISKGGGASGKRQENVKIKLTKNLIKGNHFPRNQQIILQYSHTMTSICIDRCQSCQC